MRKAKKKKRLSEGTPGQKFVARLVGKRQKRDFSKPMLDFLDEISSFSDGFREQLEFEKEFAKRDLPKLDAKPARDVLALTPYVKIVEDDKGDKYAVCSSSGQRDCRPCDTCMGYGLIYDRDP